MRTVSYLERFQEMNEFQQAVCSYICTIQVKSNQLKNIAQKFKVLDTSMDGKINYRDPEAMDGLREALDLDDGEVD